LASLLQTARRTPQVPERCNALLFTAARPGIGATTVVLNLAITAAREGQGAVVVVDANFPHPAIAQRLGFPTVPGLREILMGSSTLEHALQETDQEHMCAMSAGLAAPGPAPRFAAQTMRSVFRQLRQRAQLVLIDGPSWDAREDVAALAGAADLLYPILPDVEAETAQADALLQDLAAQAGQVAGFILVGIPQP
jgi:Mrp family chromosome partitioning ATPase